jgi:DNA-binding NtrC family response regulator
MAGHAPPKLDTRTFVAQNRDKSRIFVVDDEPIIASTLATILRMNGFDALSFTQPQEALRAAREKAPDLLISDVIMPEISGVDLAILMLKLCPGCKILLFSGQAATANLLQDAREKGHNFELLAKPIHPAEFLLKIKAVSATPVA